MVFKKVTLKDGTVVFLRQSVTLFDAVSFSKENGMGFTQMHVASEEMRVFLDSLQKDCAVTSHQEEWDDAYELYVKLNT